ncbi:MAG: rsmI [Candidatus Berkelbacteria bacterium]|nr:rsmI [Candidatus Berkelbacteria bacterium]
MGTLYVIATPIGNLEDITLRALRILKEVDLIACEDTRRAKILLDHFQISKPLVSFHQHSKLQKVDYIISELKIGKNIALVTDAGTPAISDPGFRLIQEAVGNNIDIETIPGPSSITAILAVAGLRSSEFLFLGFLPKKKGRQTLFSKIKEYSWPMVIFESPFRIKKTLNDLQSVLGDRKIIIGRELTKKFEEILRGKISEVLPKVREQGEFILIIQGTHD